MTERIYLSPMTKEIVSKLEQVLNEIEVTREWDAELTSEVTTKLEVIRQEAGDKVIKELRAIQAMDEVFQALSTLQGSALVSELKALRAESDGAKDEMVHELRTLVKGHEMHLWENEVEIDD